MNAIHLSKAKLFAMLSLVALLTMLSAPLRAQGYGSIVGAVTDPTGASVAGATVTITNVGTNDKRATQTDAQGEYRVVNLVPANYSVAVEAKSFKRLERKSVTVPVAGEVRIDAVLQVGGASETVEVTTQTPLLQTESGTVSNVVEGTTVQAMPLNGRNTMNLLTLTPGVVGEGETNGAPALNNGGNTDPPGWGNYQIGGNIAGEDAEFLDGAPLNGLGQDQLGLIPTQDSIQEFRVSINAVSPEFGRFSGGVVEMSTKSGSNAWHGTAYEYLRNTVLNANDFFSNLAGQSRTPTHMNLFGASANGPIKKDKAFFMFSWEGFIIHNGNPFTDSVPTANMNAGKFYNRTLDPTQAPAGCITNGLSDTGGTYAQVSSVCFDSTAQVIKNYFAPPNSTQAGYNFFSNGVVEDHNNEYVARVDYNVSSKQRIFGRYTYWHLQGVTPWFFNDNDNFPVGGGKSPAFTHSFVLDDNYSINSTTVLDIHASMMRELYAQIPAVNVNESQFGPAYAAMATQMSTKILPMTMFGGADGIAVPVGSASNNRDTYNTLGLDANLTKIIGRNTWKIGGQIRFMDRSGYAKNHSASSWSNFSSSTLSGNNNAYTGDEYAAFLLGDFLWDQILTFRPTTTYNYSQGYYLSDSWQARKGLTLNLGIRWELPGGMAEKKDLATVMLPNTTDPETGDKGTTAFTNSSLYSSRSVIPIQHDLFSPRVSFAQRLGTGTVIRGGYGLNYLSPDLAYGTMALNSPVNSATTQVFGNYHALSDPFSVLSGGSFLQPVARSSATWTKALLGQVVIGPVPQNMHYPYTQQWNLTLSKQWKGDWMTEVSYLGAKGTHLPGPGGVNGNASQYTGMDELSSQYYSTLQNMEKAGATQSQLIAYGQSERPYPQYQDYVNTADNAFGTISHGMYVTAEKRFHSGGVLHANYTWSKIIGNADNVQYGTNRSVTGTGFVQDFNNPNGDRSLLTFDVPQRVVISYVMPLPFGKGQKFANFNSGVADRLISGWNLDGTTSFRSGFPLAMSYNGNYLTNYLGGGTLRPNVVAGCNKKASGSPYQRVLSANWFNAACFTYPGDFAFGNEQRLDSTLRAQGADNFDFSVLKTTKIQEQTNLDFRVEFFNLFNHPQFGPPGTAMGGGGYNVVQAPVVNQPRTIQASLRLNF